MISGTKWSNRKADRAALLADAERAGFTVALDGDGERISILRRHKSTGRVLLGILIAPNGIATRADVDLTVAGAIRGVPAMRRALGLAS